MFALFEHMFAIADWFDPLFGTDNCISMLLLFVNIPLKFNAIHCYFRAKYLKSLSKSGESPFFLGNDAKNPIFRYIYDLLNDGIRGATKKDAVTTILAEIAVGFLTVVCGQM